MTPPNPSTSVPRCSPSVVPTATTCRLVEAFWAFWPTFQRWAESQTPSRETSLTPQRTRILALLQERGPQIMSVLKTELGVTATNITALVDALEEDGLVTRKAHPSDRRATLIEATEKAACKVMKKDCESYRERVATVFSTLTESERRELLRLLDKLQTRIDSNET